MLAVTDLTVPNALLFENWGVPGICKHTNSQLGILLVPTSAQKSQTYIFVIAASAELYGKQLSLQYRRRIGLHYDRGFWSVFLRWERVTRPAQDAIQVERQSGKANS